MSAAVDSVMPLARSARLYARKIQKAWQKSVEGILETGDLLIQAKTELAHGEFERMVKTSCRFSKRTAERLMKIAGHPVLSKTTHVSYLPASWGTLAELAKFEPEELSHALGNHWVKPEMTREDVSDLHRRVRKALGHRVRTPQVTERSRHRPFTAHLRTALREDVLDWLSSLEDTRATEVAAKVAAFIENLRGEKTDGT